MVHRNSLAALLGALLSASVYGRHTHRARDTTGPIINFGEKTGAPQHLASGILYGLPDDNTQIPSALLSGFGFNYNRGAGAQVGHGWSWDKAGYEGRFASAYNNYQLTRQHNGGFVMLLNDLWGFDSSQNSSAPAPGDNGDWTSYDEFVQAIISDIKSHDMQAGLVIDIWNEPEGSGFWGRSIQQWLDMWGRGWHMFNEAFGDSVLTSGPTTAGSPSLNYDWWTEWAPFVKANGSIPDQYVWHLECGNSCTLDGSYEGLQQVIQKYDLPQRQININEYAVYDEQVPAGSAFWISQLERHNAIGLRGNWLSTWQLHDFAASLLGKTNNNDPTGTGYYPNGDWWVYNYYTHNMTGTRVATTASSDDQLDAYATIGDDGKARVLLGMHPPTTGTYQVQLNNLSALGLPSTGTLQIKTWAFHWPTSDGNSNEAHYEQMGAPVDEGYYGHQITDGSVVLPWYQTDDVTTYAWEFDL